MALDGFARPDWHLVVRLWSAPKCAPTMILPAQPFVQLAIGRVPFQSCKHALYIVVGHPHVMDVLKCGCAIHIHFVALTSRACQRVPWCAFFLPAFGCALHQNRSTSRRIGPRTSLDQHQSRTPTKSTLPWFPDLCGIRRQYVELAALASEYCLLILHGLDITNFLRIRRQIHSDVAFSVTIWADWRRLSSLHCCQQHGWAIVSAAK